MKRILSDITDLTDEEIKKAFAKSLKDLRAHCNITLRDLSEQTLVPYQSLSVYERGTSMPTIAQALRITKKFGLSIDDFIWYGMNGQAMLDENFKDITIKYDVLHA